MLRIEMASQTPEEVVLKLEGWLARAWVPLLEQELRGRRRQGPRLVLDLEGVQSIDPAGLALLKAWSEQGVVLRGGSLFVRTLLQEGGLLDNASG